LARPPIQTFFEKSTSYLDDDCSENYALQESILNFEIILSVTEKFFPTNQRVTKPRSVMLMLHEHLNSEKIFDLVDPC